MVNFVKKSIYFDFPTLMRLPLRLLQLWPPENLCAGSSCYCLRVCYPFIVFCLGTYKYSSWLNFRTSFRYQKVYPTQLLPNRLRRKHIWEHACKFSGLQSTNSGHGTAHPCRKPRKFEFFMNFTMAMATSLLKIVAKNKVITSRVSIICVGQLYKVTWP